MAKYVCLLRGVNVGGVTMKMTELAQVVRELGYDGVRTVLASGNVVFETDAPASDSKPAIEGALRQRFGYDAWVHVLETSELARIVHEFPFESEREGWHPYVIFLLDDEPRQALLALAPQLHPAMESLAPGNGVLYWTVQKGNTLDSAVGRASNKPRYKALMTTRNLRTLNKLLG